MELAKPPRKNTMTPLRRELLLRLMDGLYNETMLKYCYALDEYARADEILRRLINRGMTGKQFLLMMEHHFRFSIFQMVKWTLSEIDRDLCVKRGLKKKEFRSLT